MAPTSSGGGGVQSRHVVCPICLHVFTDPVTTPCGHNYCKACITTYWDNDWLCQCPLCTKLFPTRPDVSVNTLLVEMAEQFLRSQQQQRPHRGSVAKPDEVQCDICESPVRLKALKSCLVCLTSFCEAHLERHQSVAALRRHKLVEPVRNLEEVLCRRHPDRPLELFCRTDRTALCRACTAEEEEDEEGPGGGEHQGHEVVTLEEECEAKRAELRRTEADVQRAIQERQGNIRELSGSVEQAEAFIGELRNEIQELKKRGQRLRQLQSTPSHLHLLQNFTSVIDQPSPTTTTTVTEIPTAGVGLLRVKVNDSGSSNNSERVSYDVASVRTAVAQLEKTVRREIEKLRGAELRRNMELWS